MDSPASEPAPLVPFHTFLWKVASRCNIDCTYCYVYHLADQRWRMQPRFMSEETATQTARRMREHLEAHDKTDLLITFHGGEALLVGVARMARYLEIIDEELRARGFRVHLSMQSNLTLFDEEMGDLLLEHGVTIGSSLDGPPEVNDLARVDHRGRPTSTEAERGIRLLASEKYRKMFGGILCVINADADPISVFDHLASFSPPMIDFLLPLGNHDRRPLGKEVDQDATPYGDWLIAAFDHWWGLGGVQKVRIFESIMRLSCGYDSMVESLGLGLIDLVVVEANGEIEGLDSLKGTYDGATVLGYNVFDHQFDAAAQHAMVRFRQQGMDQLSATCRKCAVVKICGGGYIPHRYSAARGFDSPSVYCRDLEKLIRHIYGSVQSAVQPSDEAPLVAVAAG